MGKGGGNFHTGKGESKNRKFRGMARQFPKRRASILGEKCDQEILEGERRTAGLGRRVERPKLSTSSSWPAAKDKIQRHRTLRNHAIPLCAWRRGGHAQKGGNQTSRQRIARRRKENLMPKSENHLDHRFLGGVTPTGPKMGGGHGESSLLQGEEKT